MFVFDENLPGALARAIGHLVTDGHRVVAARDYVGGGTPDVALFEKLRAEETDRRIIVTLDKYRRPEEQVVLRDTDFVVFTLHRAWAPRSRWMKFHGLVAFWPAIQKTAESAGPGYCVYEVPYGLNGTGRLRSVKIS